MDAKEFYNKASHLLDKPTCLEDYHKGFTLTVDKTGAIVRVEPYGEWGEQSPLDSLTSLW